jgi:Skp family chaperone for outer membrane proteins
MTQHARIAPPLRQLLTPVVTLLTMCAVPAATLTAQTATVGRVAVIDSRVILQAMPGRAQAESEFALELAKARELVHTATDSLRSAVEELSRHEKDLRPQQREAAMMILRARELSLEDMVAQLNMLASRRQSELQRPLLERIREAVRTIRKREKYALVIDVANADAIVDIDDTANINDRVIAELQRSAPPRP